MESVVGFLGPQPFYLELIAACLIQQAIASTANAGPHIELMKKIQA